MQPCMACSRASPSIHGWTAHMHLCTPASNHAWLEGAHTSVTPPPPAMHGLLARVSIHAWLDRTCASMRAHHQPCMACAHASPSMHGWTAHLHQCEPIPQPCMACLRASPSMHGSTARVHQCEPAPSHAWLARARLHPCMARRRMCIHGHNLSSNIKPCMIRLNPHHSPPTTGLAASKRIARTSRTRSSWR